MNKMYSRLKDEDFNRPDGRNNPRHQRRQDKLKPKVIAAGAGIGAAVGGVTLGTIVGAIAGVVAGPVGVAIGAAAGAGVGIAVGGAIGGGVGVAKCLLENMELAVDHAYKKHQLPWNKEELLKYMKEKGEAIDKLSKRESILEDNEHTSIMVLSAKDGKWNRVFSILSLKPYIINAIPQERAWSALHQAVWQDDHHVVTRLLDCRTCDSDIRAKRDRNNNGKAGMTPLQLAVQYNRESCETLLRDHQKRDRTLLESTLIPEVEGDKFLEMGIAYFDLAISLLKREIVLELYLCDSLQGCTEKLYQVLEDKWEYVRDTVSECLYPFDKEIADELGNTASPYDFKDKMIYIYTCNRVYRQVNAALRRASKTEFPEGDDLLLSLYSLFLTSILLHWKEPKRIQETTYRGLVMPADQAKLYTKGTTFYWLAFTSSTRVKSQAMVFTQQETENGAKRALFRIDNSCSSLWSPRDIVQFSINDDDFLEVVHPPCAKFCVTQVRDVDNYTEYSIQLLPPGGRCQLLNLSEEQLLPWNKESLLQLYEKKMQVISELSETQRLSEDNKDASAMVDSAKAGNWDEVFAIAGMKPYLINVIPQQRAWSVLHQAVWCDDPCVVARLLDFATCNFQIRAERDRNNYGEEGMTPLQLADRHDKVRSSKLLREHIDKHKSTLQVTFVSETKGEDFLKHSIPYLDLAETFLQRGIPKHLQLRSGSVCYKTEKAYELLENEWEYVKAKMRKCLYPFDKDAADHLEAATSCATLKQAMIEIYTSGRVFRCVNAILQREAQELKDPDSELNRSPNQLCHRYHTTPRRRAEFDNQSRQLGQLDGDDLLLSPFCLVLTSIFLHWNYLERTQETTYRVLNLPANQAQLYSQGATFHWMPFVSSSTEKPKMLNFTRDDCFGVKALFVIDNSQACLWSPRYLVPFCINEPDFQMIYPPLAKFRVTNVRKMADYTEYKIRLFDPDERLQHIEDLNQAALARLL